LAADFLAADFLGADFLATIFLAADFLATGFLAADFLAAIFLKALPKKEDFLATGFLAADFYLPKMEVLRLLIFLPTALTTALPLLMLDLTAEIAFFTADFALAATL